MTTPRCTAFLILGAFACGGNTDAPQVERTMVGDTTVVRTLAGSAWGDSITVTEELRVGSLDGAAELQFGRIEGFARVPGGGFVLYDGTVPALRQFDADGRHVRTLGRAGAGPGEYGDNTGVAVTRDGVVLQYDVVNSRINRYLAADGSVLPAWPVHSQLFTGDAFVLDTADAVHYRFLRTEPQSIDEEWDVVFQKLTANGELADTVEAPYQRETGPRPPRTQLHPRKWWVLSPLGHRIAGHSVTYDITVYRPEGPLRISRAIAPTPWHPPLRKEYQELFDAGIRAQGGTPVEIPEMMPAFTALLPMRDGRLWVQVQDSTVPLAPDEIRPATPEQPTITWGIRPAWDVFDPDGGFLGRVRLPRRTSVVEALGDTIWAIARGEVDEQYVVRYRINHP